MNYPLFSERDTTLHLMFEDPRDPAVIEVRNQLVRHLRNRGFKVRLDPETKRHYRSISKYHHEGEKGELRFKLSACGRSIELKFYQNVVHTNRHGGQYDFDCREKMPYLIGKQYELEKAKIEALMAGLGYVFKPEERLRGMEFIAFRRAEIEGFHRRNFYSRPLERYNSESAAKRSLKDGDVVYFVDCRTHRIFRGTAYYNLNNMWWVLLPSGEVDNCSCYRLYHREDVAGLRGRHFDKYQLEHSLEKVKEKLAKDALSQVDKRIDQFRQQRAAV